MSRTIAKKGTENATRGTLGAGGLNEFLTAVDETHSAAYPAIKENRA